MTATTVEHPGPLLPGAPRFRLDLPDGWHAAPAPRALAVARPAVDVPGFQPNLTVTADLVPAGTTAAQVLDAMLAQYPGTRQPQPPAGAITGDDAPDSDAPDGDAPDGTARATLVRAHGTGTVHQRVDVHLAPRPCPAATGTPSRSCRAGPPRPPPTCATRSPPRTPPSGSAPPTRPRPDRDRQSHPPAQGARSGHAPKENDHEQRPRHGHRRRP